MYKSLIPNTLTSLNLVFGMCSLLSTFHEHFFLSSVFILLSLVADGLDGRAARFFGVSSEIGKEMDSLCDLVSFGVAPAFLAYTTGLSHFSWFGMVTAIIFTLCGAWRLARFNISVTVVHGFFMGLAIPAAGCIIATSNLLFLSMGLRVESLGAIYPIMILLLAFLMVSEVHYPDFKSKGEKIYLVSKLLASLIFIVIVVWGRQNIVFAFLCAIFLSYALLGIVNTICSKLFSK